MKRILGCMLLALSFAASAQNYPTRAVRISVPAGTGGPDLALELERRGYADIETEMA